MSFFDDEPTAPATTPPRPRRERNRSHLRIQRLVLFLVILFVVVLVLALLVKSCQDTAKESAYRTYFTAIATAIDDSTTVGKGISQLLQNPSPTDLKAKLDALVAKQAEIAARVERLTPPSKLKSLQPIVAMGMRVRLRGVEQARDGLLAGISGKKTAAIASSLADLSGYFTGPDVYYQELYRTQAQKVVADDGVSGKVQVPPSDYFITHPFPSAATIAAALGHISNTGTPTGVHGVGLIGVTVNPGNVKLSATGNTQFTASATLKLAVTVQNQGGATESNVPIKIVYTPPGGQPQTLTASIPTIASKAKVTVDVPGISIPSTAMAKSQTISVKVGPVPGETYTSNNQATYTVTPVLSQ